MQLGMIGLGRMEANMVHRVLKGGHQCVVYDMSPKAVAEVVKDKAVGTASLAEFAKALTKPRAVWLMVPAGVVDKTIADLLPHLESGDILIDAGNSYYIDDIRRTKELQPKGIHYVDARSRALSIRSRPGGHFGGVAPRQRDRLVAARSSGLGPDQGPRFVPIQWPGIGLRRRPLDDQGRHRRRCAGPCAVLGALRE